MKFERTEVFNIINALRGMRNPLESWGKSDSFVNYPYDGTGSDDYPFGAIVIGENDLSLIKRLIKAGTEHRKFLRQIFVSVDISAPLYWWKEFDTYKIGTTSNSCSTMHKISTTPITKDRFEHPELIWDDVIEKLEKTRLKYLETKNNRYWYELIVNLPESWIQTRTITMNYENVLNMIEQRKNHKLSEWSVDFISWTRSLPNADVFFYGNNELEQETIIQRYNNEGKLVYERKLQ